MFVACRDETEEVLHLMRNVEQLKDRDARKPMHVHASMCILVCIVRVSLLCQRVHTHFGLFCLHKYLCMTYATVQAVL